MRRSLIVVTRKSATLSQCALGSKLFFEQSLVCSLKTDAEERLVLETELKLRVVVPVLHSPLKIEVMKVTFEDAPASQRSFGFWLRLVLDKHTTVVYIITTRESDVGAI